MADPIVVAAAPGRQVSVVAHKETYLYPATSFDKGFCGRFDGIVDRRRGQITLLVRCSWSEEVAEWHEPLGRDANGVRHFREYRERFQKIVEAAFSDRWWLVPSHPVDQNFKYRAKVAIEEVARGQGQHLHIYVRSNDTHIRSHATMQGSDPDKNRELHVKIAAGDQDGDLDYVKAAFPVPPATPTHHFLRCTAAHEFGHHLGLHHPKRKYDSLPGSDQLLAYGETPEEAEGMMGWGSVVKKSDYEPFLQVARRYMAEVAPGVANKWSLERANA